MPRLIKTTTEFEGRYSDVWVLVDSEDEALPAWDDEELALVGRPAPRGDAVKRVTGEARYTVDIGLHGMLHAAVLRSAVASGRVSHLDVEAVRKRQGVHAVIGPEDTIGLGEPLLRAELEFAGQPIAAVAAETPFEAMDALASFALVVEPGQFCVDIDEALNAQRFTQEPDHEIRGDPEGAISRAHAVIDVEIETPSQLHTPLETHAVVARWELDELTVWLSTQAMFAARAELAARFQLSRQQVRVITHYVGGAFGAKLGAGIETFLAAELALRARRPVRLVNTRHAEQLATGHRAGVRHTVRLGADTDGTLIAIDGSAVAGMGVAGMVMPYRAVAMSLYHCAHAQFMTFPVRLNLRASNSFRAPGVMEATTAFEQAMDELATALRLDPLELRRRAHTEFDQRGSLPYSSKELLACYDRAEKLSGWKDRDRLLTTNDGLLRGMGCASQIWFGGGGPPAHVAIRLGGDGIASVATGIQDIGTGTLTAAQLVAAEELGLPLDCVRVTGGDTGPNLHGPAAGGSSTTGSVMPAVRAAGARLRKNLLELAGEQFEVAPSDLTIREGRIISRDRSLNRPYTDVTDRLGNATLEGSGSRGPNPDGVRIQTFGCQVAQVVVDAPLGKVTVERIWAVHDVGRIINPLTARSQVEGGILQGIGFALFEERVVDRTTGVPVNATFDDYKMPTIADTPEIIVDFVNHPDSATHVGAKGLGEPPIIPTAAAVANAFYHATGRRSPALPLTPARVIEVLA